MKLEIIVRNQGVIVQETVNYVKVNTLMGDIGILAGHIPLISVLRDGQTVSYTIAEDETSREIQLTRGFVEISHESDHTLVKVLADSTK